MRGSSKLPDSGAQVAQLLSQAAELSRKAADLAHSGSVNEAWGLEQEADELRKRARKLASRVQLKQTADVGIDQAAAERGPSARANTIAVLRELGVPTSPREIAEYAWARFGVRIDHRSLPSLRRDEARSWGSSKSIRPVYIVPALEGNRFLPVRAKLALSDWPLGRRLIGPWSERADHLRAIVQMSKQLRWLSTVDPQAARRVESLLSACAGSSLRGKKFDATKVEEAATAELNAVAEGDRRWREEAAERASQFLNDEQLIWGASLPRIVDRDKREGI